MTSEEDIIGRVELFWDTLDKIIRYENHPYKYEGKDQLCDILNYICIHHDIYLYFHIGFDSDGIKKIGIHSDCPIESEAVKLPFLLFWFKRLYRRWDIFEERIRNELYGSNESLYL